MRTNFSETQLSDPRLKAAETALRACVHCGICTATCPTYVLLGDELDSPRGRIQLIQQMLEKDSVPNPKIVTHIDRCLSCLACVSACPSGVNYPRLVDQARIHIEAKRARPFLRQWPRDLLGLVLPKRRVLRVLLAAGRLIAPLRTLMPGSLRSMLDAAAKLPKPEVTADLPAALAASGANARVALHLGCVQEVVAPQISRASLRVLARLNVQAVVVEGDGCCGALNHHLGQEARARRHGSTLCSDIAACERNSPIGAVITTATGCGAVIRDYGFVLGSSDGAITGAKTLDIMDFVSSQRPLPTTIRKKLRVAYHKPCSLQHAMKNENAGIGVLRQLGFEVVESPDQACCGSAGVYNALEPEIAGALQRQKSAALAKLNADLIVTGNIGCLAQIATAIGTPVLHPIELVDWATGGPAPAKLANLLGVE
ncbi:MAG: glycolate oxidase subunit GlcF [Micropepsaceae bacterium]